MPPEYRDVYVRYTAFAFFACLLTSLYCGPMMFIVWVVSVIGLRVFGDALGDDPPSRGKGCGR